MTKTTDETQLLIYRRYYRNWRINPEWSDWYPLRPAITYPYSDKEDIKPALDKLNTRIKNRLKNPKDDRVTEYKIVKVRRIIIVEDL
jgi:hypothetical protein